MQIDMMGLTQTEKSRLAGLEVVIRQGLDNFYRVGSALLEIRDSRLYRESHKTFDDYCRKRWAMSKTHANRLIGSAGVISNLAPIGVIPDKESQTRPLSKLEPEEQKEAWKNAVATAPDHKPTAEYVQANVDLMELPKDERIKIVARGEKAIKAHVSNNSGNNEWYTPEEIIKAAVAVMGGIDLDPASSETANETVGAKTYYTKEDNGLEKEWEGENIWLNPPYAQPLIKQFTEKLCLAVDNGAFRQAIILVNNATETAWYQNMHRRSSAFCLIEGRIKFVDPEGNTNKSAPLQGQIALYFGNNICGFSDSFGLHGVVNVRFI